MKKETALQTIKEHNSRLLLTVQHTGTWSMIRFFENHSEITEVQLGKHVFRYGHPLQNNGMLHFHWHNTPGGYTKFGNLTSWIEEVPTVLTIRDPMLSLITRQQKHPEYEHFYIVDGFVGLTKITAKAGWVPIDQYKGRHENVKAMLDAIGLPYESWMEKYILRWPRHNQTNPHDRPLTDAYRRGDIDSVREAMPEEFEYLLSKKRVIIPFLKRHGYKDMIWWNL